MYVCSMLFNKYSKNILDHHLDERMYTTYSPLPQTSAVQGGPGGGGWGSCLVGNESVPKIIINDTTIFFLKLQSAFW